jgi:hypothetical protein
MRKSLSKLIILAAGLFILYQPTAAYAQVTRTWVSGTGDDANACSRTAPCRTFIGAMSKTATGGIINCLDPGVFGALPINRSITIDCSQTLGAITASGVNGITINASGATVILRHLTLDGLIAHGSSGAGLIGISIVDANTVVIEDCVVEGFKAQGILDSRTAGGKVLVSNTTVRDNADAGLAAIGSSSGNTTLCVSVTNLLSKANAFGIAIGTGVQATVERGTFAGNTTAGLEADSGGNLLVNEGSISGNATGIAPSGTIVLANSDVSFNVTGITAGKTVQSYTNNRFFRNAVAGGTITPIGTTSNPTGQQ